MPSVAVTVAVAAPEPDADKLVTFVAAVVLVNTTVSPSTVVLVAVPVVHPVRAP